MDVVIVGPCGAGKTTLARALRQAGYSVRAIAQEHSVIPYLWRHGGLPDAVIFLDVTPAVSTLRRGHDFPTWLYEEQQIRLAQARSAATFVLDTTTLSASEVQAQVLAALTAVTNQPVTGRLLPPGKG